MTGPSTNLRSTESGTRAALARARGDVWTLVAGVVAFLFGTLATWIALRGVVWDVLKTDLNTTPEIEVIAVTPFDVIFLQAQVAVAVGVLLAVEAALYRTRGTLLGGRWWPRDPLPAGVRVGLVAVGVALFPVGAVLGYDHVFPVVLDAVTGAAPSLTIIRWSRVALLVSFLSGLAAQLALVAGVVGLGRLAGSDERAGSDEY